MTRGQSARAKFVESHVSKGTAFQVQALRDKKGWSQQELADRIGSNQNAVYRLENPNYGRQTITTLRKVAATFDVALIVRFVPFSQLVDWVSGTPHVDRGLSEEAMAVPSFQEELDAGAFNQPGTDACGDVVYVENGVVDIVSTTSHLNKYNTLVAPTPTPPQPQQGSNAPIPLSQGSQDVQRQAECLRPVA